MSSADFEWLVSAVVFALFCLTGLAAIPFLILPVLFGFADIWKAGQASLGVIVRMFRRERQLPLFGNNKIIVTDLSADGPKAAQTVGDWGRWHGR